MTKAQRQHKLIDSNTSFWMKWLPWRYVLRKFSQRTGFLDPLAIWSKLGQFSQPSEVASPIELLRAGLVFHARGLVNTKVIQYNLDWIWPYWVEKQYDPESRSFVPRGFSISHINLTHRNWTAVGVPGCNALPIVDPRGLVTPYFDGWSLDGWLLTDDGELLAPSRLPAVDQDVDWPDGRLRVRTHVQAGDSSLTSLVWAEPEEGDGAACCIRWTATAPKAGWLVVALRPANPEGVSFIHAIGTDATGREWQVDADGRFNFDTAPDRHVFSRYRDGDVVHVLPKGTDSTQIEDDVGLATAAMLFRLEADTPRTVQARVDLRGDVASLPLYPYAALQTKQPTKSASDPADQVGQCRMQHPRTAWTRLYDIHRQNLLLHAPFDVYPGPYTYKRFWFRDATYILHAMITCGMHQRVRRLLEDYPSRQTRTGYFRSQEGEWDSNGQVLWLFQQYHLLTGEAIPEAWQRSIIRGARWIIAKREDPASGLPHAGLLPAGFSAEHLGSNDHYYWDDYWSVSGLRAAADLAETWGDGAAATEFRAAALDLLGTIDSTILRSAPRRSHAGIPASPYRRMDAGAIGSVVCGYPLQLVDPDDDRLIATADFLINHCFQRGCFFQDMIHSGMNAYLSLHIAQVLLRAGDPRALPIIDRVEQLASSTGNWPEAIHPATLGGCMGDGQHIWAAADWLLVMRALFVRIEEDTLVLLPGLDPAELAGSDSPASFGPTPTPFGELTVTAQFSGDAIHVAWTIDWRVAPAHIRISLPGLPQVELPPTARETSVPLPATIRRRQS